MRDLRNKISKVEKLRRKFSNKVSKLFEMLQVQALYNFVFSKILVFIGFDRFRFDE